MGIENQESHGENAGTVETFDFSEPPECKVVIYNDDFTTKEFVVEILTQIFHKNEADAVNIMEQVHHSGSGLVGTYTYDIAMTRANMATSRARKNGFPLRVEVDR